MQDSGDRSVQDPGDRYQSSAGARCDSADAGEDCLEHALGLAFRQLNRRDRTVSEIEHHLAAQHVEADVAGRAVKRLCEQGYLDDARLRACSQRTSGSSSSGATSGSGAHFGNEESTGS